MEETSNNLEAINRALDRHNDTMLKIMESMPKQDNLFIRGLAIGGSIAGVLGIFDFLFNWLRGII